MSSMDRVFYKPLGTSARETGDDDDDDDLDDNNLADCDEEEEHKTECELEERSFSRQSSTYQYKYHHHQGILSGTLAGQFGLRQLRLLLYLVTIMLFLIFVTQLSSSRDRNVIKTLVLPENSAPLAKSAMLHANKPHSRHDLDNRDTAITITYNTTTKTTATTTISNVKPNLPQAQEATPGSNRYATSSSSSLSSRLSDLTGDRPPKRDFDWRRPEYDSYLSSVISERNSLVSQPESSREFYDDLAYSSSSSSSSNAIWWTINRRNRDKYLTVTNYIRAMKSFTYNASITLTTQATTEFMYHTLELCKRWDGPISVAIFTPGPEFQLATTLIKFMRRCLPMPLSACIRDKVTWHMVYNREHGPKPSAIGYPKTHLDLKNYPLFVDQDQCPKFAGPEPIDSIRQFEEELRRKNGNPKSQEKNYREQFKLPYPINVLRNTARLAASTKYVLASDIELYPSINLVPSFKNLIERHDIRREFFGRPKNIGQVEDLNRRFVFTLPIFEVKSNVSAPKTKQELVKLTLKGDAIFFHKWVCDACQNFPNRLDWLQTDRFGLDNYQANSDELVVFKIAQRNKTKDSWEPIFIGTNEDPLYDDRLTWDGRRDKMAQMYEMCLQDYQLLILGNAFLVHAPGIKHIDKDDQMKRLNYIRENNVIYDETMLKLKQQYSSSSNIDKC